MNQDFWRITGIVGFSLVAGLLAGHVFLCVAAGTILVFYWYRERIQQLLIWLRRRTESTPPDVSGFINDIIDEFEHLRTHHKQRGEKLSGFLRRFQAATAALPDAAVVLGEFDSIEWANEKAEQYLGLRWPQDSGQRISNLIRHPDLIRYLQQTNERNFHKSLELASPVNHEQRLEFRVIPYGESQRLLMARDITEIHHANKMRKDFIANASHELRTPLTVIAGYLENFEEDRAVCPPDWMPRIKQMRQQTARMQRLIEDLLQLSSLETPSENRHTEEIRVADMLGSIYKEAESFSGMMHHIFYLETDPDLWVRGNQRELYSAFSNLIFNAVQYTPPRSVIRIRWYRDDRGAHMEVIDSGEGIAPSHIPRLTERFYRVDKGRSREKGGTGLGLAIVKHALSRHDARLRIESELGKGSKFRCDFPLSVIVNKPSAEQRDRRA